MVKHTKGFKGLSKKVLSAILAASMIMTSSSFVLAAEPTDNTDDVAVVSEVEGQNVAEGRTVVTEEYNISTATLTYNGQAQKPVVTIQKGEEAALKEGTDFEVLNWEGNVNASKECTATIKFLGTYAENANREITYVINPASVKSATVNYDTINTGFVYGQEVTLPEIYSVVAKVTVDGKEQEITLQEGVDYKVPDEVDTTVGDHEVQLEGIGNFNGKTNAKISYSIAKAELNSTNVSASMKDVVYSNNVNTLKKNIKNALTVIDNVSGEPIENVCFDIEYKDADGNWSANPILELGTQTIRIKPNASCANYAGGSVEVSYEIVTENTLQSIVDASATIDGFVKDEEDGILAAVYDSKDHFVETVAISKLNSNDFKVVTPKAEWINAGEYTVELEGLGKYAGQTAVIPVKITPMQIAAAGNKAAKGVTVTPMRGTHSNKEVGDASVSVVATIGTESVTLENGTDYTYEVVEGKNGKFTVKVTGIGNFTTAFSKDVTTINKEGTTTEKLDLGDPSIVAEVVGTFESGKAPKLTESDIKVVETFGGKEIRTLNGDDDFYISKQPSPNVTAGETTVTIKAKTDSKYYNGVRVITFKLTGVSFADTFNIAPIDDVYTNTTYAKILEAIKVTYKSSGAPYTNYKVEIYDAEGNLIDANAKSFEIGTYTVKVTSNDTKLEGELETTFNVLGADLNASGAEIKPIDDVTYTGEAIEPEVVVAIGEKTLKEGRDYTVAYSDNVNGGEATVTVTGINDYSGTITKNFNITQADQGIYMTVEAQERDLGNGSRYINSKDCTLKLATNVADPSTKLTFSSSDTSVATVSADGVIRYRQVGECVVTVTAAETENCKAATLDIKVKVGKVGAPTFTPSVTSTTAKKSFRVTTSTVRGADGFEVQYSIKSNFWAPKTKDFKIANKVTRQTCTTAQSNKTYYIRTRAYQVIDGEKVYSAWSPVKTVKTK